MHRLFAISCLCAIFPAGHAAPSLKDYFALPQPRDLVGIRDAYIKDAARSTFELVARAMVNVTVQATPTQGDSTYLIPVGIGAPASTYSMSVDLASSDVSVYAPKLGTSGSVTTTFNIGAAVVKNQVVDLSNDATGGSNYVGMSYTGNSFYANAVKQGVIAPVFTSALKRNAVGTYTLGFINKASYTGPITYVAVTTSQGFWQFPANGYSIGSGSFQTLAINGIVDSGTTLLYLPQSLVTAYYKQVSGAANSAQYGGYVFPCSATLPNLVIGIGSYRAIVPGSYLNYAPVDSTGKTCYGGLQSDTGIGFSIFGLVFIVSQFLVFQGTTSPTIGFAKLA